MSHRLLAWPCNKPFSAPSSDVSVLLGLAVRQAHRLAFGNNPSLLEDKLTVSQSRSWETDSEMVISFQGSTPAKEKRRKQKGAGIFSTQSPTSHTWSSEAGVTFQNTSKLSEGPIALFSFESLDSGYLGKGFFSRDNCLEAADSLGSSRRGISPLFLDRGQGGGRHIHHTDLWLLTCASGTCSEQCPAGRMR